MATVEAPGEEQRSAWTDPVGGLAGDLQRQYEMGIDFATCRFDVESGQRRGGGAGTGQQHMVDRCRQLVEESSQSVEVGGVEGGDAGF